nr:zinc finger C2HC domain-containing protein 1A-like [Halyomorpha halys]
MAQGSKDLTPTVEMELVPCRVCGRTFIPERIEYHESVCKSKRKEPRKPYDSVSHRWKGTDNEPAIKWIKSNSEPKPPKQEHRAESRDRNELPFPKPAELQEEPIPAVMKPDGRVECPSCKRSFEESAASRHIPGCTARAMGRRSR